MSTQAIHIFEAVAQRYDFRRAHAAKVAKRRWLERRETLVATMHRQCHKVMALLDKTPDDKTIYEIEQLTLMVKQLAAMDRLAK